MALNIFLTLLLVSRLLYMRHKITSTLGAQYGKTYTGIATMVLESALPYGLVSLIFIVLYSIQNIANLLFLPLLVQVQVCFPRSRLLIYCPLTDPCFLTVYHPYAHYSAGHPRQSMVCGLCQRSPDEQDAFRKQRQPRLHHCWCLSRHRRAFYDHLQSRVQHPAQKQRLRIRLMIDEKSLTWWGPVVDHL